MKSIPFASALCLLIAPLCVAQPPIPLPPPIAPPSDTPPPPPTPVPAVPTSPPEETTLSLAIDLERRGSFRGSRVTVPAGDTVTLTVPGAAGLAIEWLKDGVTIVPGANTHVLVLRNVTTADAGNYQLRVAGPIGTTPASQSAYVGVGPTHRIVNLSTRARLAAGAGQNLTTGFVVDGNRAGKKLVVRLLGPDLARFGSTDPLRNPVLRIVDSGGRVQDAESVRQSFINVGRNHTAELADALARVGAFPLTSSGNIVFLLLVTPGTYTAQVTSSDHSGGEFLLEIYEVP